MNEMKTLLMKRKKKIPVMMLLCSLLLVFVGDYLYNELLGMNTFLNGYYIFGLVSFGLVVVTFLGKRTLFLTFENTFSSTFFKMETSKNVFRFMVMMLFFEFIQMLMDSNNIFLVNGYFEFSRVHLYGTMVFVGKFLHILVWATIILLLPRIIRRSKNGISLRTILLEHVRYIVIASLMVISCCYFFPGELLQLTYGDSYAMNGRMLGKYVLVVTFVIVAKMFTYYFLYRKQYLPAFLTIAFGISQPLLIILFHSSIVMVVHMQLIVMISLVIAQLLYFAQHKK